MKKSKYYYKTRFSADVLEEAHDLFLSKLDQKHKIEIPQQLCVTKGQETWELDSREEFLTECRSADSFHFDHITQNKRLILDISRSGTSYVCVDSSSRPEIGSIFNVFEKNVDKSKIVVETEPIKVFIGHGRDPQWRDLKDHLHDQHGLEVVSYEIGPRAGLSVKDVLEGMLNASSFALLILTGEDQHIDGEWHARQNVTHELGLFQGRLGFPRAIALLEDGVQEFSNILGVNQIRFSKGSIREAFGDVVATIRREFETNG
jgi:predicted nucleotide-binding protein